MNIIISTSTYAKVLKYRCLPGQSPHDFLHFSETIPLVELGHCGKEDQRLPHNPLSLNDGHVISTGADFTSHSDGTGSTSSSQGSK